MRLKEITETSTETIVMAIHFDISGAFDHLKWETVVRELIRQCTKDMVGFVRSYLSNGQMYICTRYEKVSKIINNERLSTRIGPRTRFLEQMYEYFAKRH